jgi:hypothetical protein
MVDEGLHHHPLSIEARLAVLESKMEIFETRIDEIATDVKLLVKANQALFGVKSFIYFLIAVAGIFGVGSFAGKHLIP